MLQYAKKALVDKIKKEKEVKRKKEQEKHNIAGKLNKITEYDNLKETIKIVKEGIGVIALALVIVMGLFSLCGITVALIIVYDSAMAVIFLPKSIVFFKQLFISV
ncbi:MAG: hypothetical protein K2L48_05120 [Mycoplasmoidaceae bacterium]|nr:hypothetical protein [Mycoplasmoidaceae bacterium]